MATETTPLDQLSEGYVASTEDVEYVILWNGSATFNVWVNIEGEEYSNIDAFTVYDVTSFEQAKAIAEDKLKEILEHAA